MHDDESVPRDPKEPLDEESSRVSRRDFLKISTIAAAVPVVATPKFVMAAGSEVPVHGPGKVPMQFNVNGKGYKASLEPRVTLLDALRDTLDITGAKRVCDKAECGSCTVLLEDKAGLRLLRAGHRGARQEDHHGRGSDGRRQAASHPAGLRRQ